MLLVLGGCGNNQKLSNENAKTNPSKTGIENFSHKSNNSSSEDSELIKSGSNILVVNFSCTGNTKSIAEPVSKLLEADLYEIMPEVPYTDDDIDYSDKNCRANKEQADDNARPKIDGKRLMYRVMIL